LDDQSLAQRFNIDVPLLFGLLVLFSIGLVILYSASGQDIQVVLKQLIRIVIALILMFAAAQLSPQQIERWSLWIYLFGICLLVWVLIAGHIGKGAQRWIDLGLFRFQPSEIMKLAVPMVLAWFLADKSLPPRIDRVLIACVLIIIPVVLIAKQPDLGTALLVAAAGLSILFISGVRWRLIFAFSILAAVCTPILWHFMHDYQRRRVLMFINPLP